MKCPVCKTETTELLCPNCEFDMTRNIFAYPSLVNLKKGDVDSLKECMAAAQTKLDADKLKDAREEEAKRKAEEEKLRKEEEAKRKAEEEKLRKEAEANRKAEEEAARQAEELQRKMEEARRAKEEETTRQAEEAMRREKERLEEEKRKAEEAQRKADLEVRRQEQEAKRKAEEEELRRQVEEEATACAEQEAANRAKNKKIAIGIGLAVVAGGVLLYFGSNPARQSGSSSAPNQYQSYGETQPGDTYASAANDEATVREYLAADNYTAAFDCLINSTVIGNDMLANLAEECIEKAYESECYRDAVSMYDSYSEVMKKNGGGEPSRNVQISFWQSLIMVDPVRADEVIEADSYDYNICVVRQSLYMVTKDQGFYSAVAEHQLEYMTKYIVAKGEGYQLVEEFLLKQLQEAVNQGKNNCGSLWQAAAQTLLDEELSENDRNDRVKNLGVCLYQYSTNLSKFEEGYDAISKLYEIGRPELNNACDELLNQFVGFMSKDELKEFVGTSSSTTYKGRFFLLNKLVDMGEYAEYSQLEKAMKNKNHSKAFNICREIDYLGYAFSEGHFVEELDGENVLEIRYKDSVYADLEIYYGEYAAGERSGKGLDIYQYTVDGKVIEEYHYDGEWKSDLPNGQGTLYERYSNGVALNFKGTYVAGKAEGRIQVSWDRGSGYVDATEGMCESTRKDSLGHYIMVEDTSTGGYITNSSERNFIGYRY